MKRICFLSLILLTFSIYVNGISLPEAQKLLLSRNPDIAMAQSQTALAKSQLSEARSTWHPSLTAYTTYGYQTETPSIELTLPPLMPGLAPLSLSRSIGDHDKVELGVDLTYPLFTGLSGYYSAKSRERAFESQRESERALKQALLFNLGMLYFAWELSYKKVSVQNALVEQLSAYATQMRNLKEAGMAVSSRVAEAEMRLAFAKTDLIAAQNQADSLKLEMGYFINSSDSAAAPEEYRFPKDTSQLIRSLSLNQKRPEINTLDLSLEQLEAQNRALSGRLFPGLSGVAGYRYGNPGLGLGKDEFMGYGLFGLSLSWNIYDGFKTFSQKDQIRASLEIIKKQKEKQLAAWDKNINIAQLRLVQAQRQHEAAQVSLNSSQAFVNDTKNAYEAGSATSLEYLNALSNNAQAQFLTEQSRFMIKAAYLSLLYAAGEEITF